MGEMTIENERMKMNGTKATSSPSSSNIGGSITLDENVVATIAGLCASEIDGVHQVGKPRLIPFGNDPVTRGVEVEVGQKQAAVDLDVIVEYGTNIEACATRLRTRLAEEIKRMTNRDVVEVNIHIADIHMPEVNDGPKSIDDRPRVV